MAATKVTLTPGSSTQMVEKTRSEYLHTGTQLPLVGFQLEVSAQEQ